VEPERSGGSEARGAAQRTARGLTRKVRATQAGADLRRDSGALGVAGLVVLALTIATVGYPFPTVARVAFLLAGITALRVLSGRRYAVLAAILVPLIAMVTPNAGWWTVVPPLIVGGAGFAWSLGWFWPLGSLLAAPLLFVAPFVAGSLAARFPALDAQLLLPMPEADFLVVQVLLPALMVLTLIALERFTGLSLPWRTRSSRQKWSRG